MNGDKLGGKNSFLLFSWEKKILKFSDDFKLFYCNYDLFYQSDLLEKKCDVNIFWLGKQSLFFRIVNVKVLDVKVNHVVVHISWWKSYYQYGLRTPFWTCVTSFVLQWHHDCECDVISIKVKTKVIVCARDCGLH
jgi:hypothetical protein